MKNKILALFQYNNSLKFSEIEKLLKTRSNKLAFWLKKLVSQEVLEKSKDSYGLSETSESIIPYLSEKNSALPVLLVHIGNSKACFLWKRNKRPFKDMLSLPGGRILVRENIAQATTRLMLEKFNIRAKLKKVNSVSIENLKKNNKVLYTHLLIFVTASSKDKIPLINIEKNRRKIITSDYKLLRNDLNKQTKIKTIFTTKI